MHLFLIKWVQARGMHDTHHRHVSATPTENACGPVVTLQRLPGEQKMPRVNPWGRGNTHYRHVSVTCDTKGTETHIGTVTPTEQKMPRGPYVVTHRHVSVTCDTRETENAPWPIRNTQARHHAVSYV